MATDPYTPDQDDKNLIINDVVVIKDNQHYKPVTGLHKWRDIWNDDLHFKALNSSTDTTYTTYRAIALSTPMFYSRADNSNSHPYIGYVVGVHIEKGQKGSTEVYPVSGIIWE